MDKDVVQRFKDVTGYSLGIVSERFGVSRQFVHQAKNNHSLTYNASFAFYLTIILNERIEMIKKHIEELEYLKEEIAESVKPGNSSHDQ